MYTYKKYLNFTYEFQLICCQIQNERFKSINKTVGFPIPNSLPQSNILISQRRMSYIHMYSSSFNKIKETFWLRYVN